MKGNTTRGIFNNGVANITQKILRVLDQLLLIPFFLKSWGAAYYGEWLTLTIIPSILAFSDLGFGSAVSNSFILAYASGDKQKAANLSKSGLLIISCSICIGALLTIGVLLVGKHIHLFEKSLIPIKEAMTAVTFLMIAKLFSFYNQLIEGYYRGARKAALGSFISSGQHAINLVTGLCVLYAGCGIIGYSLSQLIVSLLFTVTYFIIGNRMVELRGFKGIITCADIRMIITKGLGYIMSPIWQSIYFQGGTFVVRLTLGPESVAVFNTIRTVCRSVNQIFTVIEGSILPELQYEYGKGNISKVHRLFRIAILLSMCIGIIGIIFLFLFGLDIYAVWTQNILSVSKGVWFVFVTGVLFNAVWWTSIVTYRITNQPYHFAISSTITACLSVGSSYFLSIHLGLLGAALGAVLFDVIMMFYVLPDSCHLLGMRTKDLFSHIKADCSFLSQKLSR